MAHVAVDVKETLGRGGPRETINLLVVVCAISGYIESETDNWRENREKKTSWMNRMTLSI